MRKTKSGLPEEYKKGYSIFLGCKIDLSRRVLIPRPESEFWTEAAINDLKKTKNDDLRILDIFSGSGCVGIAAAKYLPDARVDFSDIDKSAIGQININLDINRIGRNRAEVFESDIFEKIPPANRYDAILANPPYIDPARIGEVQESVLDHEPRIALFSGGGGLETIKKFLRRAIDFLKPEGFIYLEFDASQMEAVEDMAESIGYLSISFFKDQFGVWRFAKIMK